MRVMVIGASTKPQKYGHKAVVAHRRQGHDVFPVHPEADRIEGVQAYPDVSRPPGPIDRAILYLPPEIGRTVLPALAERDDVAELWVSPGAESPELIEEAERLGLKPIQACSIMAIGERP